MASREFVVLSLDGSRALADWLGDDCAATNLSSLDHYKARPNTPPSEDNTTERDATTTELDRNRTYVQEWMLLCQRLPELGENSDISDEEVDWLEAGRHVANLEDSCSFITRQKESGSQLSSCSPSPKESKREKNGWIRCVRRCTTNPYVCPSTLLVATMYTLLMIVSRAMPSSC